MVESTNCPTCNTSIPGTNCALKLSAEMGWKKKAGCYAPCPCKYPVKAKEVRAHIFTNNLEKLSKEPSKLKKLLAAQTATNAYIYCENGDKG